MGIFKKQNCLIPIQVIISFFKISFGKENDDVGYRELVVTFIFFISSFVSFQCS